MINRRLGGDAARPGGRSVSMGVPLVVAVVAMVVVTSWVTVVPTPVAAASAPTPFTGVFLDGELGSTITPPLLDDQPSANGRYTGSDVTAMAAGNGFSGPSGPPPQDGLAMTVDVPDPGTQIALFPPSSSTQLAVGSYPLTENLPGSSAPDAAEFSLTVGHYGCSDPTGTLDVDAVSYNADGSLASLAARLQSTCGPGTGADFIVLAFNSTRPFLSRTIASDPTAFADQTEGTTSAPQPITVTNTGSGSLPMTSAQISGADAEDFAITADGCSGQVVAVGAACTIEVAFAPVAGPVNDQADLTLVDGVVPDPGRGRQISLSGTATGHDATGEYTPVVPTRLLDTRTGETPSGLPAPLGPGQSLDLAVTGPRLPVVGAISVVVVNVTVTDTTASSFLTVFPTDEARPTASNLNWVAGQVVANLVTVKVDADGEIRLFNNGGSTDVVVDLDGYYASAAGNPGSRYHPAVPTRLADTRTDDA